MKMTEWMSPGIVYALFVWIGGAALVSYMARERGQNVLIFFLLSIALSPIIGGIIVAMVGYKCQHSFASDNPNVCTSCGEIVLVGGQLTDSRRLIFLGAAAILAISILSLFVFGVYYPATKGQIYAPPVALGVVICT